MRDATFATATADARWPEPDAADVVANPGVGDLAVNLAAFSRRTPLEAENALRHALSHVVAREASAGRIPRGFDEGLASYFEQSAPAELARHAALDHHDYDRAQTLLQQARAQYDRLGPALVEVLDLGHFRRDEA